MYPRNSKNTQECEEQLCSGLVEENDREPGGGESKRAGKRERERDNKVRIDVYESSGRWSTFQPTPSPSLNSR